MPKGNEELQGDEDRAGPTQSPDHWSGCAARGRLGAESRAIHPDHWSGLWDADASAAAATPTPARAAANRAAKNSVVAAIISQGKMPIWNMMAFIT